MQELMTNFKNKYGQTISLPKIYQDKDSSDSEGLALEDGTRYGKKTTGGGGSKGGGGKGGGGRGGGCTGGNEGVDPKPGPSRGGDGGDGGSVGGGGGGTGGRQPGKRGHDDNNDDDPNKRRKKGVKADHRGQQWLVRNHASQAQLTPQLTETCHLSISLAERRELGWAIAYWTRLRHRRGRYMRQGCRGGW